MKEDMVFMERWSRGVNRLILKSSGKMYLVDRISNYHRERGGQGVKVGAVFRSSAIHLFP